VVAYSYPSFISAHDGGAGVRLDPEDLMSARSVIRRATGMVLSAVAGPLAAQDTLSAPAGLDSASIAAGRLLYQTRGGCVSCHGEPAEGTLGRCVVRRCSTLPRCGGSRLMCFRSAGRSRRQSRLVTMPGTGELVRSWGDPGAADEGAILYTDAGQTSRTIHQYQ
jgi:hypothetical protein